MICSPCAHGVILHRLQITREVLLLDRRSPRDNETSMRAIDASEWLDYRDLSGITRGNQGNNFTLEAQQVAAQAPK